MPNPGTAYFFPPAFEVPVFHCQNPKCDMDFTVGIFYVTSDGKPYQMSFPDHSTQWHCPWCGKKTKKSNIEE